MRPIVTQMTPHILAQLRSTFEMQLLSNDDKEERDNLQSALCALIQLITRAIQGEIAPYCDDAMTLLLQVFTTSTTAVASEEAFMAIGAIAAVLEKGFDKYMVAVQVRRGGAVAGRRGGGAWVMHGLRWRSGIC